MAALNSQTAAQFRQYAAQQYPGSSEQQQLLVRQLQEQHYQQYMQQLYQAQLAQQQVRPGLGAGRGEGSGAGAVSPRAALAGGGHGPDHRPREDRPRRPSADPAEPGWPR